MLEAIAERKGLPLTADLVQIYQTQRGLTVDGIIGPQTRRALIEDYMGLQDTSLRLPQTMSVHGCGESFPITAKPDEAGVKGEIVADDAAQRRVEAFLYDGGLGVQPPPPGPISQAGSLAYPEWVRRARHTREWSIARTHAIALRVQDTDLASIPGARVVLDDPPTELIADADGIVTIPFREGQLFRKVSWGRPTEPQPEYSATFFLEFDDDDDGAKRKLHNLGYPKDDPVSAFQREFSRPVTGNLDDIRDEVHLWHDHGPAPVASSEVAFGQSGPKPDPGVSPKDPTSKATVAGTTIPALVVGVTVGGVPPQPTDDMTVSLVGQGSAKVGTKHPMKPTGEQRFDGLSDGGTYELTVSVGRAHAGGGFFGSERQTVAIDKGRKQAETNVRIPLATIRKHDDTGPAATIVEKGKTLALLGRSVPKGASPSWSAGAGLVVDGPTNVELTTVKGQQVSQAVSASFASLQQTIDKPQPGATGCTATVLERFGSHNLLFTVAELQSISCTVRATEPVSERKWMENKQPSEWTKRQNRDQTFEAKETEFGNLVNFIRGSKPLELSANVVPKGLLDLITGLNIDWSLERAGDDNDKLGNGKPTLEPTGPTATCKLNETGTFFISAKLNHPALQDPTPRVLGLNLIEVVVVSATAHTKPSPWSALNIDIGGKVHGALTSCEDVVRGKGVGVDNAPLVAVARAILRAGGSKCRRNLAPDLVDKTHFTVGLGWINNLNEATVRAEYNPAARIDSKFTQNPIKEDASTEARNKPIHPKAQRSELSFPVLDAKVVGDSDEPDSVFLSPVELLSHKPLELGLGIEIACFDGPGLVVARNFAEESENKATGTLKSIDFFAKFRCFLCAFADNFSGPHHNVGSHSYVALFSFTWKAQASATGYGTSPTIVDQKFSILSTDTITATDAKVASCETRGPGAAIASRSVLDY